MQKPIYGRPRFPQHQINVQKPKKRPLALDSEKRACSEKRAKTEKARITSLPSFLTVQDADLVGTVEESDFAHRIRHGEGLVSRKCARCFYIRSKAEFSSEYPWLQPRPLSMGGHWRLGCNACSLAYSNSEQGKHEGKRRCDVEMAKFAGFNFLCRISNKYLRSRLKQHSLTKEHRAAVLASNRN